MGKHTQAGSNRPTLQDVSDRALRQDEAQQVALFPIASRISRLVSWAMVRIGASANHATALFAVFGIGAALAFAIDTTVAAFVGLGLYWLSVLMDFADGDLARYRQQFGLNARFWDRVIHNLNTPLIIAGIAYGRIQHDAQLNVVAVCLLLIVVIGLYTALNDLALRLDDLSPLEGEDSPSSSPVARNTVVLLAGTLLVGIGPLLRVYTAAYLFDGGTGGLLWRDWVLVVSFGLLVAALVYKLAHAHSVGRLPYRRNAL